MVHVVKIAFVAAASLAAGIAVADPLVFGISGDPQDGNIVIISGLDFGSNPNPEPLVWDDFEAGSNGQVVAGNPKQIGGTWNDEYTNVNQRPVYSNQSQRLNSGLSTRHIYQNSIGWNSSLEYLNENLPKAFISFWWRYDSTGPVWSRNVKPWMVYGNLADNNRPMVYVGLADAQGVFRSNIIDTADTGTATLWGDTTLPEIDEQWIRLDTWLELSTPGVTNGTFQSWVHKPYAATPSIILELDSGENQIVTRVSNGNWRSWRFGTYMAVDDPSEATGTAQIDDIYIASTRARVEIGNASRWPDVTQREIQIARDWSDGSVSFEMNQGGLESIAGAYVYVIDAQGRVNSVGLPLCDDCPNPPTGLSAQGP